jgi:putative acetyltransferase
VIRPEREDDHDAVRRVVADAFAGEPEVVDLVDALRRSRQLRASLVAEVDDEVVGHVMLSRGWLDAEERLVDVLVLSPLAVAPAHQGRGVGSELVAAAVTTAAGLGAPALFLEGDPGYYGRLGFEAGALHGFEAPSHRIPGPAFQVVVLPAREPWMTGRLVYAEVFWELDCVGLRTP